MLVKPRLYFVVHPTAHKRIYGTKADQGKCDACYYRHSLPLFTFPSIVHIACLTNDNLAIFGEVVLGYLKVERGGSLSYAARDIVVGTVAGAEPAAEVTSLANGNASKMGADTCSFVSAPLPSAEHDVGSVPSMINHSGFFTRSPSAWGSRSDSHFVSSASLISSSVRCRMKTGLPRHLMMTYDPSMLARRIWEREKWATHVLALRNGSKVNLNLGLGQNVGGSRHVDKEICKANSLACIASIAAHAQSIRKAANGYPATSHASLLAVPVLSGASSRRGVDIPCTVAFAPMLTSAPMVPTMKY